MSINLDDLLNEVKPPPQALDLANTEFNTREQFDAAFSKVPEHKIRPEKVRIEEIWGNGEHGWRGSKSAINFEEYTNPLPKLMRGLDMSEFYGVSIDWRMLTTARPSDKLQEEIFSRYVDLGRAQLALQKSEQVNKPDSQRIVKLVPGRGSAPETRIPVCRECCEELCTGICIEYLYDRYTRMQPEQTQAEAPEPEEKEVTHKTKKKTRKRKKSKKTVIEEVPENSGSDA